MRRASYVFGSLGGALLYGVAPRDLLSFGLAATALALVALAACVIPACRAARIDPAIALRNE